MAKIKWLPPAKPKDPLIFVGIDCGWRNTGVVTLEKKRKIWVRDAQVLESVPTDNKKIKVLHDDHRRIVEQYLYFKEILGWATGCAIEAYKPNPKQKGLGGGAWKTCMTYALACAAAEEVGVGRVIPHWPSDIKALVGDPSASKADVQNWIIVRLPELGEKILDFRKGEREHLCDAGAHAFLGLQKICNVK